MIFPGQPCRKRERGAHRIRFGYIAKLLERL